MIEQTPKFFHQLPIVIDLQHYQNSQTLINFAELAALFKQMNITLVGVRNGNPEQQLSAKAADIGILPSRQETQRQPVRSTLKPPAPSASQSKVITQPVRSGQQIYAKDSDLIILNTVSEGAEVLADGNIHIYGALRGRALAGLSGNTEARIFCQNCRAELVSIAGHYQVNEQIELPASTKGWQIYLKDQSIRFAALG
jgi:septum site-determining protein MinC